MTGYQKLKAKYDVLIETVKRLEEESYRMAHFTREVMDENPQWYRNAPKEDIVKSEWDQVNMITNEALRTIARIEANAKKDNN